MRKNQSKGSAMLSFAIKRMMIRAEGYNYITPNDEHLLDTIALAYVNNERLSVKDLMNIAELGSPAHIHQRIQYLRSVNLIQYSKTDDKRRYQVEPTAELLKYFDKLGKAMKRVASQVKS